MIRCPDLPLVPGYSINWKSGQTRFHKSHHFEYHGKGVAYLANKTVPGIGGESLLGSKVSRFPSIYARGDVTELPSWIAFDKQTLVFDAHYTSMHPEIYGYDQIIHKCKIYFYLEDGSIKVAEPKIQNSAIPQGCIISRKRIRFPSTAKSDDYYDIIDFNIGKEVELCGKLFTITNCDRFTRTFLNRLGIAVGDPLKSPEDPYTTLRAKEENDKDKVLLKSKKASFQKFLELDGRILTFHGYWDDTEINETGFLHLIQLNYYLCDNTIDIKDCTDKTRHFTLVKRCKLPKEMNTIGIGDLEETTRLNLIWLNDTKYNYIKDPLNIGKKELDHYTDRDLAIGAVLNAYGKRIVLTNCDKFTQEFYKVKYGLDSFTPLERPLTDEEKEQFSSETKLMELPNYNGFGTYEDSERNCKTVFPFKTVKSYKKFYEMDKFGYDGKVLRFTAKLISENAVDSIRNFIVNFYLSDDTVSVYEVADINSGFNGGLIINRRQIIKPGQVPMGSKRPEFFSFEDFFIGNTLLLEKNNFYIVGADEYTLKYLETHTAEYSKGNHSLILNKIKDKVRSTYKQFASNFFNGFNLDPMLYMKFRDYVRDALKDEITEQEIVTLARKYLVEKSTDRFPLDVLRRYAHDSLRKGLFDDYERLRQGFLYKDVEKTGRVTKSVAYSVIRGSKLPLDVNLINLILEKYSVGQNSDINYNCLIEFLNYKSSPAKPIEPISISDDMTWINVNRSNNFKIMDRINVKMFLDDLGLEPDLIKESQ